MDIEVRVQKCEICQESQNSQTKGTLEQHEIPTRPWQDVGTDVFSLNGDEYLLSFPLSRRYQVNDPRDK